MAIIIIINGKFLPLPTILHPSSIYQFAVLRLPRGNKGVARGVEEIRRALGAGMRAGAGVRVTSLHSYYR